MAEDEQIFFTMIDCIECDENDSDRSIVRIEWNVNVLESFVGEQSSKIVDRVRTRDVGDDDCSLRRRQRQGQSTQFGLGMIFITRHK